MGIRGLIKLLGDAAPQVLKETKIESYEGIHFHLVGHSVSTHQ